jgi:AcrR family transcriptional regulator
LFYRDGINATGVERLAAESSVSKRTLYQYFPSKTAVVEEYLRSIENRAADPHLLGNELGVLHEDAATLATSLDDRTPWAPARAGAETLIDRAVKQ